MRMKIVVAPDKFKGSLPATRVAAAIAVLDDAAAVAREIGKVLKHALAESKRQKINAVVFVGDCMEEAIDALVHAPRARAANGRANGTCRLKPNRSAWVRRASAPRRSPISPNTTLHEIVRAWARVMCAEVRNCPASSWRTLAIREASCSN